MRDQGFRFLNFCKKPILFFLMFAALKAEASLPASSALQFEQLLPLPVVISEILPYPNAGGAEFIEFYNLSLSPVDLKDAQLFIGERKTVFKNSILISSENFFVINQADLPVTLRNSGRTIILKDKYGKVASQTTYINAPKGAAWALNPNENYEWTLNPTPGKTNRLTQSNAGPKTIAINKIIQSNSSSIAQPPENTASTSPLVKGETTENADNDLAKIALETAGARETNESANIKVVKVRPPYGYLIFAFAALVFFVALIYFSFFKKPQTPAGKKPEKENVQTAL